MNEAGYSREGTLFSSKIVCKKCGLIILKQNVAVISYLKDVELPNHNGQKEPIEEFVMVNDVYAFENVGFLKAVGEMKVSGSDYFFRAQFALWKRTNASYDRQMVRAKVLL